MELTARGPASHDAFPPHHAFDAEKVIAVADGNAIGDALLMKNRADALRGLVAVTGFGFGNDVLVGNAALFQVAFTHAALAEFGVASFPSSGDDEGRVMLLPQFESMVETGAEDGRGVSVVLRRAEDNNGASGLQRVSRGGDADADVDGDDPEGKQENPEPKNTPPASHAHKISATSPAGIAPAR